MSLQFIELIGCFHSSVEDGSFHVLNTMRMSDQDLPLCNREWVRSHIGSLDKIAYGYLRITSTDYNLFLPEDVKRLCYLWFHPKTIHLNIIKSGRHLSIGIIQNDTIFALKQQIERKLQIPPNQQRLVQAYLGKQLHDEFAISDYNLHNDDTLELKVSIISKR